MEVLGEERQRRGGGDCLFSVHNKDYLNVNLVYLSWYIFAPLPAAGRHATCEGGNQFLAAGGGGGALPRLVAVVACVQQSVLVPQIDPSVPQLVVQ